MPKEISQASGTTQAKLEALFQELEKLQTRVKTQRSDPIRFSKELRDDIGRICKRWNNEILFSIAPVVATERLNLIDGAFQPLKQISLKRNSHIRKATLIDLIEQILSISEQILFEVVYPRPVQEATDFFSSAISKLERLNLSETLSLSLLKEANACIRHSSRAAVMLSWSAAMGFLHDAIEQRGFDEFCKSAHRAAQKKGRFERLNAYKNQPPQISARAQLVHFNEGHLLLALEEMNFYNEDAGRLLDWCFTLRNQAAHPTDFRPTPRILETYRAALEEYIFGNEKIISALKKKEE